MLSRDTAAGPFHARAGVVDLRDSFAVASASEPAWTIGVADVQAHEAAVFDGGEKRPRPCLPRLQGFTKSFRG